MKTFLEQGHGIFLIGAVAGVGVLCKWCLLFYYAGIGQACKAFAETKNKTIAFIRTDLEKRKNEEVGIKSAMIYTECRLAERRVLGIRVGALEILADQSLLLVLLCGVLVAFSCVLSGCEDKIVFQPLFFSGVLIFLMIAADLIMGLKEKRRRVRLSIRDYIENKWASGTVCVELSEEPSAKEIRRQKKAERKEEKANKKLHRTEEKTCKKAQKVRRVKERQVSSKHVRGRKNGKAQEEKRRLTEELLRERRQLEARQLAQQRNKEIPGEIMKEEEPVREEAAATTENIEMTYEMLLSEVIAEYLA